jgi:16S rRNA (cytosine1407-C5)-methyltransferase
MRSITNSERQNLSRRQQRLLESALQAVRPGGEVVYATCTLSPEEDEMVLEEIKRRYGNQIEIIDMNSRLPQPAPALSELDEMEFHHEVQNGLRIWPHLFHTSGFFSAKIRKLTSWQNEPVYAAPSRDMGSLGWLPVSSAVYKTLTERLQDDYGLDLTMLQNDQALRLYHYQEKIFAFPEKYFEHFDGLPVQMLGILLGKLQNDLFSPEHDFVTRFFDRFQCGKVILPKIMEQAWLRGEDIHDLPFDGAAVGKVLLTCNEKGEYIGLGKATHNRYRNLLPRRVIL